MKRECAFQADVVLLTWLRSYAEFQAYYDYEDAMTNGAFKA